MVFALVSLKSQAERDLVAFEDLARSWPLVRECHMLNGEIDFVLKCMAPNLLTFQTFLTGNLTAAPNVASVKTSLVIRAAKDEPGVPFEMSDYVTGRIDTGQYGNVSEFFRDLVRRDQERRQAIAELQELMTTAEASGVSPRQVPEIMKEVEDRLQAHRKLSADE